MTVLTERNTDKYKQNSTATCAYLCSDASGKDNDPELGGLKKQEVRGQEEGHGLLLSPWKAQ